MILVINWGSATVVKATRKFAIAMDMSLEFFRK